MSAFGRLHHVCVVVHDIDRAQAYYESVGIGPWHDYPPLDQYTELDMPDPGGFRALKYRYALVGEQQIQLCQPGPEPTPQRRFLDERGEGVFHVGFEVPDANAAEAEVGAGVRDLPRPAVLEVRYDERDWPGPSPFVDPPVVRSRFEQAATARAGSGGSPG